MTIAIMKKNPVDGKYYTHVIKEGKTIEITPTPPSAVRCERQSLLWSPPPPKDKPIGWRIRERFFGEPRAEQEPLEEEPLSA